jgi:chromate transporter
VLEVVDAFYRTGSLVFGGGHVVLPLLQAVVIPTGWVSNDIFLAGYGAAQAMPGPCLPLLRFLVRRWASSFRMGRRHVMSTGNLYPFFLLVTGALPFWEHVKGNRRIRAALSGINAAVVGLLLAALYNPIWTTPSIAPRTLV